MTLREKLADWITGGKLTNQRKFSAHLLQRVEAHDKLLTEVFCEKHELVFALRSIAAMETPGANATVRRMARTAQEAVK